MKNFTPFEKKILNRIAREEQLTLQQLLNPYLPDSQIEVDLLNRTVRIISRRESKNEIHNTILMVVRIVELLKKLRDEDYIALDVWRTSDSIVTLGSTNINSDDRTDPQFDHTTVELLIEFCQCIIRAKVKAEKYITKSAAPSRLMKRAVLFIGSAFLLNTGVDTAMIIDHFTDKNDHKQTIEVVESGHTHKGPQAIHVDRFVDSVVDSVHISITITDSE
jgi:hypothetical protein